MAVPTQDYGVFGSSYGHEYDYEHCGGDGYLGRARGEQRGVMTTHHMAVD